MKKKMGRMILTGLLVAAMVLQPVAGIPVVYAAQEIDEQAEIMLESDEVSEAEENTEAASEEPAVNGEEETAPGESEVEIPEADAGESEEAVEELSEEADADAAFDTDEDVMSYQGTDIVPETKITDYGADITWKIDGSGKLTITGSGEFYRGPGTTYYDVTPWYYTDDNGYVVDHRNDIKSAEVDLTDVKQLYAMFYECKKLQTVTVKLDLSGLAAEDVVNMSCMFMGCESLKNVTFSSFSAVNVNNMSQMFRGCTALETLDLRSFASTENVENMSYMFYDCTALKSLNLSGFDTQNVDNMSAMFQNCAALQTLDLSSFNTENVQSMDYMFRECGKLASLKLGERFSGQELESMVQMFYECSSLTKLDLKNFALPQKVAMENAFYGCGSLKELQFAAGSAIRVKGSLSFLFSGCAELETLDLSGFNTAAVTDMSYMFYECSKLKNLDVSGFDTGNVTNMHGMFYNCNALEHLDVSGFNTAKVTDMGMMFYSCSKLKVLDVSKFITNMVTSMEYMFSGCSQVAELDVSKFNTAQVTKMTGMFCYCSSLKKLNVSGFQTQNATAVDRMFFDCSSLERLDVGRFDTSKVTNADYMFCDCTRLKELDMSSFNLTNCENADRMLINDTALTKICTPRNLSMPVKLPQAKYTDKWCDAKGKTYTALPMGSDKSIVLAKNGKPDAAEVKPETWEYECGDILDLSNLTVLYDGQELGESQYTTNASEIDMTTPGKKILIVTLTNYGIDIRVELEVCYTFVESDITVTWQERPYTYTAYPVMPQVASVSAMILDKKDNKKKKIDLTKYTDYRVTYRDNVDVGNAAKMVIKGEGYCSGSVERTFSITPATVTLVARDTVVKVGDPWKTGFDYTINGLLGSDTAKNVVVKAPDYTVKKQGGTTVAQTSQPTTAADIGIYEVTPAGAEAKENGNYTIGGYRSGTLTVAEEKIAYTVTFDLQSHAAEVTSATIPKKILGVKAGSLISEPTKPIISGDKYLFKGWYQDAACTKAWNFDSDVVQGNLTLYACWAEKAEATGPQFVLQEIPDQYYTGSAIKPAVTVYTANGTTLLKAGKDYTIAYYSNTNADVKQTGDENKGGTLGAKPEPGTTTYDGGFDSTLPYVMIQGKGNYSGFVCKNFHIRPAAISDGTENAALSNDAREENSPAAGVTLKYTDQLVMSTSKAQKPFSSVKYKKSMKAGQDYTLSLTAVAVKNAAGGEIAPGTAFDGSGNVIEGDNIDISAVPAIPKNHYGAFKLTIKGTGNYAGIITKTIQVAEQKNNLLKNASITLGSNIKKGVSYTGEPVRLKAATADGADVFTVKMGTTCLQGGTDYMVSYENNNGVGTAVMTITGIGSYVGAKSVTFKITGAPFTAKNIAVAEAGTGSTPGDAALFRKSLPYTGKPLTQNGVSLSVAADGVSLNGEKIAVGTALVYGKDYTVSYKNNLKKGTATMTFTALPASGWTGSFKKTFTITAAEIGKISPEALKTGDAVAPKSVAAETVPIYTLTPALSNKITYTAAGAKISDRIALKNAATGKSLIEGTDYTVSYTGNKVITPADSMAAMVIKGKGNYAGSIKVEFPIGKAFLTEMQEKKVLQVTASAVAFNPAKAPEYAYQPAVTVKDGSAKMKGVSDPSKAQGKDYIITYKNCEQSAVATYLENLENGAKPMVEDSPHAEITATGDKYTGSIKVPLNVYHPAKKLTGKTLYVIVEQEQCVYADDGSGSVKPDVRVYFGEADDVKAAKGVIDDDDLIKSKGAGGYGLTKLSMSNSDITGKIESGYAVSYGANNTAGNNKGSVTITGTGLYGGSVTVKFKIEAKKIYNK